MNKLKYFLSLFVTCLILTSFISCVNAESNINKTINNIFDENLFKSTNEKVWCFFRQGF